MIFFWDMWILMLKTEDLHFRQDQLFLKQSIPCSEKKLWMEPTAQRQLGKGCDRAEAGL